MGATIAPGSHEWNGYCADLVNAPTSTSTSAATVTVPDGGAATSSPSRKVPACWPSRTSPASIASPPSAVTSSACWAAARAPASSSSRPMSRYEVTDVSSQAT